MHGRRINAVGCAPFAKLLKLNSIRREIRCFWRHLAGGSEARLHENDNVSFPNFRARMGKVAREEDNNAKYPSDRNHSQVQLSPSWQSYRAIAPDASLRLPFSRPPPPPVSISSAIWSETLLCGLGALAKDSLTARRHRRRRRHCSRKRKEINIVNIKLLHNSRCYEFFEILSHKLSYATRFPYLQHGLNTITLLYLLRNHWYRVVAFESTSEQNQIFVNQSQSFMKHWFANFSHLCTIRKCLSLNECEQTLTIFPLKT